jgi:hypothetical protein
MAIPFLNNIDLSDNQLLNAKLQVTTTAPTAAIGQIYFDSTAGDETAKYYSNTNPDQWVSLKEYSFPTGTYVAGIVAGTTPKPTITFDLNAADGTAAAGERYLTKTNKWAEISTIPGTYNWTLQGDTGGPTAIPSASAVSIIGGQDLETTLVGTTLTLDLKVGPQASGAPDNYIMNQGTAVPSDSDTLAFSQLTAGNPPDGFSTVKKTTLGTIPVTALTLVKTYIDESVTGLLQFIGGFNANTGDLDSPLTTNLYTNTALAVGDLYVVSTAGNFFGNAATPLTPGDSVIVQTAAVAGAAVEADFIVVQSDTDLATLTTVGIGNVNASTLDNELGIEVAYAAGTAKVGLDIEGLALDTLAEQPTDYFLPIYDAGSGINNKAKLSELLAFGNQSTSKSGTITAGNLSGTVTHDFGINTIVQTISSSGDTVFCDVTRTATTSVATIAVAEATDITILVQKIG